MDCVVYFGPSHNRLLQFLLPREFQHCFMVIYSGGQRVVIDPTVDGIVVMVTDEHHRDFSRYVPCTAKKPTMGLFGVHSCVSYIKRMLGINKWWIITPKQLYKELSRGNV